MLHVGRRLEALNAWWNGAPLAPRAEGEETSTSGGMTAPSRTAAARSVSVGEAISLPMTYRAVQILSVSGKQMSIETTRNGRQIDDHPLTRKPDPFLSRSKWIQQNIISLATTGNCYYEIIGDILEPSALPVLNPLDVRIVTNRDGLVLKYLYHGREIRPSRIKHLTLMPLPGVAYGLGPIQAGQADLRGALDTRDYAANWFESGGQPTGVLKTEQVLDPQRASDAKDQWNTTAGAKNGVAVLGSGLSYQPIFLSPKDVQFIESRQFDVTGIARMFGVPASLMLTAVESTGGASAETYQNVEQDWLGFVRFTLMDYLVEIEDALSSLLPGRQQARFNIEALLRADTTTRYQSYKTGIEAGFLEVNEVRDLEHMGPIEETADAEAA